MRTLHLALTATLALAVGGCSTPGQSPEAASVALTVPGEVIAPAAPTPVPPAPVIDPDPVAIQLATLRVLAPQADPGVLALALEARQCAVDSGDVAADSRLAVIDYSRPSTEQRMWVFALAGQGQPALLYREHVAHGQGSGGNIPDRFSNRDGTHATSLGLFRTAETYYGSNGYSMRMDGLDPGFNDNARGRAIVIHGADYVNPAAAKGMGRLGRSWGCPALRQAVAREMIDVLKDGNLVFSYAEDDAWLDNASSFACDGRDARGILAAARMPAADTGNRVAAAP